MFVYIIVNSINGKIYIGKTKQADLKHYFYQQKVLPALKNERGCPHLFAAIRKYGREHFQIFPLISSLKTNEELCFWERVLIAQYDSQNPDIGYNICKGGEGFSGPGFKGPRSEEWKQKIRKTMKKRGIKPSLRHSSFKDITGQVLNGVTVLSRADNDADGSAYWNCRCFCGKEFKVGGFALRSGHTRSCGCLKLKQNGINLRGLKLQKERIEATA